MIILDSRYRDRFHEAIRLICQVDPPPHLVDRWVAVDDGSIDPDEDTLQDWCAGNVPFEWATWIGVIDAAEAMAKEVIV